MRTFILGAATGALLEAGHVALQASRQGWVVRALGGGGRRRCPGLELWQW